MKVQRASEAGCIDPIDFFGVNEHATLKQGLQHAAVRNDAAPGQEQLAGCVSHAPLKGNPGLELANELFQR